MNKEVKLEVIELTPSKALELLKINRRNVPIRNNVVLEYARQMKDGLWKFNGEPIIISNTNLLLDGQHRLAAIVKSQTTQKCAIIYNIENDTFDTIDTGKIRTASDMMALLEIKNYARIAALITSYLKLKKNIDKDSCLIKSNISKQEIMAEYNKNTELWQQINALSATFYSKIRLLNMSEISSIIGYLYFDKKHNFEKIRSFFYQLFYDKEVENTIIISLRDKLLKHITSQYKMTNMYKRAIIIKTWNAYIKGKEAKLLNFNIEKENMPEFI